MGIVVVLISIAVILAISLPIAWYAIAFYARDDLVYQSLWWRGYLGLCLGVIGCTALAGYGHIDSVGPVRNPTPGGPGNVVMALFFLVIISLPGPLSYVTLLVLSLRPPEMLSDHSQKKLKAIGCTIALGGLLITLALLWFAPTARQIRLRRERQFSVEPCVIDNQTLVTEGSRSLNV